MKIPFLRTQESHISVAGTRVKRILLQPENNPFQASIFTVESGIQSKVDQHHDKEIWVILESSGILTYDHKNYDVEKDDLLYFEPCKKHTIYNNTDIPLKILSLWWD